ncbi:MAG: hypothetical protein ACFFEF_13090 [Candidatus Thorarchaeota archaeon]
MNINTVFFEQASQAHTERVLDVVKQYLESETGIEHIVVATTEGNVGAIFAKAITEKKVIVVTHQTGFRKPNYNELDSEKRKTIEKAGATILTTTHAFAGVDRGIRRALGTYTTSEILAYAFRTFGQGTKVCAEIAMMAADAGLVPVDRDVICVGGTGRGADTAWIIKPANTNEFVELKMKACLCKPLNF